MRAVYLATLRSLLSESAAGSLSPHTTATLRALVGPFADQPELLQRMAAATGDEARAWEILLAAEREAKALTAIDARRQQQAAGSAGRVKPLRTVMDFVRALEQEAAAYEAQATRPAGRRAPRQGAIPPAARYRRYVMDLRALDLRPTTTQRKAPAPVADPGKLLRRATRRPRTPGRL